MRELLDLDRYPLDRPDGDLGQELLSRCRNELERHGMFSLPELVRPEALRLCVDEVAPILERDAFTHAREHNIYFDDAIAGVEPTHPALRRFRTVNHTICADQFPEGIITRVYEWQPLLEFLAATMDKSQLYPMADPLARINVMAYYEGEMLNWHFDRSEFTTTLLLQAPHSGGAFQYRSDLRRRPPFRTTTVSAACWPEMIPTSCPSRSPPGRSTSSAAGTRRTGVSAVAGNLPRIIARVLLLRDAGGIVQRSGAARLLWADWTVTRSTLDHVSRMWLAFCIAGGPLGVLPRSHRPALVLHAARFQGDGLHLDARA